MLKRHYLPGDQSKLYRTVIGFDINQNRINQLKKEELIIQKKLIQLKLKSLKNLFLTSDSSELTKADFIVTVPTPIDSFNRPNLNYLEKACQIVGKAMKQKSRETIFL